MPAGKSQDQEMNIAAPRLIAGRVVAGLDGNDTR
jgi:hypothetical protein